MRGPGQIAELVAIAEPDVGVIVNVGPVHLELLGSLEAIAAAKAELLVGLRPGSTAVVPFDEPLLDAHLRTDLRIVTFGEGGDVADLDGLHCLDSAHMRRNALAALAAASAVGAGPRAAGVTLSACRPADRAARAGVVIDDAQRQPDVDAAALDDLAASAFGAASPCSATCSSSVRRSALPRGARRARVGRRSRRLVASVRARHGGRRYAGGCIPSRAAEAALCPGLLARETRCSSRLARRRAGDRARAARGGRGVGTRGRGPFAGTAALLICIFLSPSHRLPAARVRQVHREEGPERTTSRRARRRWADHHVIAISIPS